MRIPRKSISVCLLLAGGAFYIANLLRKWQPTGFDDAYMFVRYARNILAGHGLAWNAGDPPTFGPTSLLYVGLVTLAVRVLPLQPGVLLVLLSWLLGLAFLVALGVVSAGILRKSRFDNLPLGLALVLLPIVLQKDFRFHAGSGMDTQLALLMNAALIGAAMVWVERPTAGRWLLVVLAGYGVFLARPDGAIYALLFPALLAWMGRRRSAAIAFSGVFCALLLIDALVKREVFGYALPLSAYVKRPGFYAGYPGTHLLWNPVEHLYDFAADSLPFVVLATGAFRRRQLAATIPFVVPVIITFLCYFNVTQIMGNKARYYYPALPFVAIGALRIFADGEHGDWKRWLRRLTVLTLVVVACVPFRPRPPAERTPPALGWQGVNAAVGSIARQLPPGSVMTGSEVGLLGAMAPQITLIDLVGLNDRAIALNGFSAPAVLKRKPDLIWFPHPDYVVIVRELLADHEFRTKYRYFEGAYAYGMAIRREGPHYAEILEIVRRNWTKSYPGSRLEDFEVSAR